MSKLISGLAAAGTGYGGYVAATSEDLSVGDVAESGAAFVLGSALNAITGTIDSVASIGTALIGGDPVDIMDEQGFFDSIGLGEGYQRVEKAAEFTGFIASSLVGGLGATKAIAGVGKLMNASGKASKFFKATMNGVEAVDELAGLRAPLYRKSLIVQAANEALQGASVYANAMPKGKLLAASLGEGLIDNVAFELGMWSTSNQFSSYNEDKKDPFNAFVDNISNNYGMMALGVPISSAFYFKESLGAGRKLIDSMKSKANEVITAGANELIPLSNTLVDKGTVLASIGRAMSSVAKEAAAQVDTVPLSGTVRNISATEGNMLGHLETKLNEAADAIVTPRFEGDNLAAIYANNLKEVHAQSLQAFEGRVSGLAKVTGASLDDMYQGSSTVAKAADSLSIEYSELGVGSYVKSDLQEVGLAKYQLREDGFLEASGSDGIVIHKDFSAMPKELQAIAIDRQLNAMAVEDVLGLAEGSTLAKDPSKVIKSHLTRAKNYLEEIDPRYTGLADAKEAYSTLVKIQQRVHQAGGKTKITSAQAATLGQDILESLSTTMRNLKTDPYVLSKVDDIVQSKGIALFDDHLDLMRHLETYIAKETDVLYEPRRMFGNALGHVSGNPQALAKMDVKLAALLRENNLLDPAFSNTKFGLRNMETGNLVLGKVVLNAADVGLKFKSNAVVAGGEEIKHIEGFRDWNEVFSQPSSIHSTAQFAYAEHNAQSLLELYRGEATLSKFDLHHQDAVLKAVQNSPELIPSLNIEGVNSLQGLKDWIQGNKEEAIKWITGVEGTRFARDTWTMDNVAKYIGSSGTQDLFPMLKKDNYWRSPVHVREYRKLDNIPIDAAGASAMIDAQIQAANAARALRLAEVENMNPLVKRMGDTITPEFAASSVTTASVGGGAGFLAGAQAQSAAARVTQAIGETLGAQRQLIETTFKEARLGSLRSIDSAGGLAEFATLINKVQSDMGQGIRYKLIQKDSGYYMVKSSQAKGFIEPLDPLVPTSLKDDGFLKVSSAVGNHIKDMQTSHMDLMKQKNIIEAGKGGRQVKITDDLYFPPADISTTPHVRFFEVRGATLSSENQLRRYMVVGADEASLNVNAAAAREGLDQQGLNVVSEYGREEAKARAKAGVTGWDHTMDMGEIFANSGKGSSGLLQGLQPKMDAAYFDNLVEWEVRQQTNLLRDYTREKYSTMFDSLEEYSRVNQASRIGQKADIIQAPDPFKQMMAEALNLPLEASKTWGMINSTVESTIGRAYYAGVNAISEAMRSSKLDSGVTWEAANEQIKRYGLPLAFDSQEAFLKSHYRIPEGKGVGAVRAFNMVASTFQLGLDTANMVMNIATMPIRLMPALQDLEKEILTGYKGGSKLADLCGVKVPDSDKFIVSPMKSMLKAATDYAKPETKAFIAEAKARGLIKNMLQVHNEALGEVTNLSGVLGEKGLWSHVVDKAGKFREFGTKWSGNKFGEEFTRYIVAKSAHDIATAAHLDGRIAKDEIWTHVADAVRKLHGTSLGAARPEIFKGVVGSGMMLFQGYQFSMIQQLMGSIAKGNRAAAGTMIGAQAIIAGGTSLPGFDLINESVAKDTSFERDVYSKTYDTFGEDVGNFLLYGMASTGTGIALYGRADTNPRAVTIVPTSPVDFPAVAMMLKTVNAFTDTAVKLRDSGGSPSALLEGLVLSGLHRPTKMLVQEFGIGGELSQKGNVIAPWSQDHWGWNTFAHALGARTMNEALTREAMFRNDQYRQMQQDQLNSLGQKVKTAIRGGTIDAALMEDFAGGYHKAKGNITNFNHWMEQQLVNATPRSIEQVYKNTQSSKYQDLMQRLGSQQESYLEQQLRLAQETPLSMM